MSAMPRKPVNQHRALAAVKAGRVIRVQSNVRAFGSWALWTGERWRAATSGESHALDALIDKNHDMIEVTNPGDERETIGLTPFGEVTLELWSNQWGPIDGDPTRLPG